MPPKYVVEISKNTTTYIKLLNFQLYVILYN